MYLSFEGAMGFAMFWAVVGLLISFIIPRPPKRPM